jgi:NAD(P)-dependent dehydrogenase (short-subunit alcohol dehydrogenase family)
MPQSSRRVVVVTGASAGVGRATARAFAKRGWRVGLLARGRDGLLAARREVEAAGSEAVVVQADVANFDQVESAAAQVEQLLGPIDVWVNNAMTSVFSPVKEMTALEIRRVTDVTYLGCVHGTLVALKRMLPRDRGTIIQVGSAVAKRSIPLQSAYCAAKHAIEGFTESLRCELLHDKSKVSVTLVHLPAMNTPQFDWCKSRMPRRPQPVPPIFQPEVAAEAIVWAADHGAKKELWVGAPTVKAIVGNKIAAPLLDRYLARTGYEKQQTNGVDPHDRPTDLWAPVAGDHGARGSFDARARSFSLQTWVSLRRGPIAIAAACFAILAGSALWARNRR